MNEHYLSKELINSRQEWVFDYFYNKYAGSIKGYAHRILKSNVSVDDIVQDIFINFFYKLGINQDFKDETHVRNYLYRCCWTKCNRSLKGESKYLNSFKGEEFEDFLADLIAAETIRTLYGFIEDRKTDLSPQVRKILILIYIEGKTVTELSKELNQSISGISTLRRLGVKMLRELWFNGSRKKLAHR